MGAIGDFIAGIICEEGDAECAEKAEKYGMYAMIGGVVLVLLVAAYMMMGKGGPTLKF
jgi:hypothetical protein